MVKKSLYLKTLSSGVGRLEVTSIQMEGMHENKRAFKIYPAGVKKVTIAVENGLADRCVNIHEDGKLDAIDSDANPIKVDTFPVCGDSESLADYGCGLAVQIYFDFHKDFIVRAPPSPSASPSPSHPPTPVSRAVCRVSAHTHAGRFWLLHRNFSSCSSSSRSTRWRRTPAGTICATSAVTMSSCTGRTQHRHSHRVMDLECQTTSPT